MNSQQSCITDNTTLKTSFKILEDISLLLRQYVVLLKFSFNKNFKNKQLSPEPHFWYCIAIPLETLQGVNMLNFLYFVTSNIISKNRHVIFEILHI